jgi:hypothetical protein
MSDPYRTPVIPEMHHVSLDEFLELHEATLRRRWDEGQKSARSIRKLIDGIKGSSPGELAVATLLVAQLTMIDSALNGYAIVRAHQKQMAWLKSIGIHLGNASL